MNNLKPNATGLDCRIKDIQQAIFKPLCDLWGEVHMYGRADKNPRKDGVFPEVYTADRRYVDVYLDSKKLAQVFFLSGDVDQELDEGLYESKLKVVFIVNLDRFNAGVHKGERRDDLAHLQARQVLEQYAYVLETKALEKTVGAVFSGYDTSKIKFDDMHPFEIFAITGTLTYDLTKIC